MTDIALEFDSTQQFPEADIVIEGNDLKLDQSFETSVIVSLFSDARVTPEELGALALEDSDPRGWWGDNFPDGELVFDPIGSKAWLVERNKITRQLQLALADSMRDALQWMIEDDIAESVTVDVEILDKVRGIIGVAVAITKKFGSPVRFDFVWDGQAVKRVFNAVQ